MKKFFEKITEIVTGTTKKPKSAPKKEKTDTTKASQKATASTKTPQRQPLKQNLLHQKNQLSKLQK